MDKFQKRHIERVRHSIGKTIHSYNLIEDNDHILIGLSGGKDSLILLETLSERRKYIPIEYRLTAVHINVVNIPYVVDIDYLRKFSEDLNVSFILKELEYSEDSGKSPCFFCSWSRRKIFYELSKELNISKIATGHHMDDALETLFMNMVYHGSISSLPVNFTMFDGRLEFIRPMIEIPEDMLKEYALIRNYPTLKSECPHDKMTKRKRMREQIDRLQGEHDAAKINMFRSMSKIIPEYLPGKDHIVRNSKLRRDE